MSETSEEKTKRKYLEHLNKYEWHYQYSVFYANPVDSLHLLDDMVKFKQRLRRRWPETAFLIRIQSHKTKASHSTPNVLQAFLSIFCTSKLEGFRDAEFLDSLFSAEVRPIYRALSISTLQSRYRKIKEQKPHDLSRVFKDKKSSIKRWSVLNKDRLVKREVPLMELEQEQGE